MMPSHAVDAWTASCLVPRDTRACPCPDLLLACLAASYILLYSLLPAGPKLAPTAKAEAEAEAEAEGLYRAVLAVEPAHVPALTQLATLLAGRSGGTDEVCWSERGKREERHSRCAEGTESDRVIESASMS